MQFFKIVHLHQELQEVNLAYQHVYHIYFGNRFCYSLGSRRIKGLGKSGKKKGREEAEGAPAMKAAFCTSAHFISIIGLIQLSFQRPIKFMGALFYMTDYVEIYRKGLNKAL